MDHKAKLPMLLTFDSMIGNPFILLPSRYWSRNLAMQIQIKNFLTSTVAKRKRPWNVHFSSKICEVGFIKKYLVFFPIRKRSKTGSFERISLIPVKLNWQAENTLLGSLIAFACRRKQYIHSKYC